MSDYFPFEVIDEIFQRLPIKSLVRCMSVCRAWKSIITNQVFITSHHHHIQSNPANSSLFIHLHRYHDDATELKGHLYSLYSVDDDSTDSLSVFKVPPINSSHACEIWMMVGTCNGLVCFADYCNQAVIWNPSILKYLILPQPSFTLKTWSGDYLYDVCYGFGFDSQNHDFKVVRIVFLDHPESISQFEIYSLASHSWRSINVAAPPFRIADNESKFVNGILHWKAYRTINGMDHSFILTFDVVEEKFGELMLPQCLKGATKMWGIFKGGNLLSLKQYSVFPSQQISIWVMKEYSVVESWTRLFHFDSRRDYTDMLVMSAFKNNEEVFIGSDYEITFLNPIKGLEKKIQLTKDFILCVGDHVESLFLINEKNSKAYLPL